MEQLRRTKVIDLLQCENFGTEVNVKGWVRTRRGNKQVSFIALNDGSTIHNIQVVIDLTNFDEEQLKTITTGACISVNGVFVESQGKGQKGEIQATCVQVLGEADPNSYPLQKKRTLARIFARDSSPASTYQYLWGDISDATPHGICHP